MSPQHRTGGFAQPSPDPVAHDGATNDPTDRKADANGASLGGRHFIDTTGPNLEDQTGRRPLPPFPGDALKIAPPLQA